MNAIQSKQVLAIAQEAIAMLPHELTLALRVRLEQAIASPIVSKTKSAKISKKAMPYKPIVGAPSHRTTWMLSDKRVADLVADYDVPSMTRIADPDCQCAGCQIDRGFFERGRNRKMTNIANDATHFDNSAVIAKLELCACGHDAQSHDKDDLENLLQCHGLMLPGNDEPCDCERFHYDVDSEAA